LQFLNIFRCKWTEEDIDIEFTPGYSSTPENESRKHVLTPPMVDRTSLQTIIDDAILIALTRKGFLYLALLITPCAPTFPSLESSCKPPRRRESSFREENKDDSYRRRKRQTDELYTYGKFDVIKGEFVRKLLGSEYRINTTDGQNSREFISISFRHN
jgi:hypothetical protein